MILSMYEADYRMLQESGSSLKELAREVMSDLEQRKGMNLEWIAAVHEKSGHPHVHISIMSVGKNEEGKNKRLQIDKQDFGWLRDRFLEKIETRVPDIHGFQNKETENNRPRQRSKTRSPSRDVVRQAQTLAHSSEDKMLSQLKDKRNKRRRTKRATSRVQEQRKIESQTQSQTKDH